MAEKVTLEDLARMAGVHRSTVSLALRNHPRISTAMRDKIQQLAHEHDYRINPLVAALMQSRRSGTETRHVTLAFVTVYPTRYGWRPSHHSRPDFYPGAVERARELGYSLEHFWLAEPGMTTERFCDILATRNIHGLLIGRLPPGLSEIDLPWERFSSVALGMTLRSPQLNFVTENHFDTAWQSMRQCYQRGCRRIGFVFSEEDDSPRVGNQWLSAYLGFHAKRFPDEAPRVCPQSPPTEEEFAEWYLRERPRTILATHAGPVLRWLEKLNVKVPDDVALIDLQADPELGCAGVFYEPARIGMLAVEMLIGLLHRNETGIPDHPHETLLSGRWRDGWSLPERF
ncbi:MAG: LacI family DNA-binding transcriptional regulator [Verrucomicrobiota bacterium JB022]|nr:LacI family DNA-binding transcriptional regulator [Verrucomicrobiota bacterium JB022]